MRIKPTGDTFPALTPTRRSNSLARTTSVEDSLDGSSYEQRADRLTAVVDAPFRVVVVDEPPPIDERYRKADVSRRGLDGLRQCSTVQVSQTLRPAAHSRKPRSLADDRRVTPSLPGSSRRFSSRLVTAVCVKIAFR